MGLRSDAMGLLVFAACAHSFLNILFTKLLGQEPAKGAFGLRVKLPPAHLSTTHGGGFTLTYFVYYMVSCSFCYLYYSARSKTYQDLGGTVTCK